jgi:bacteriorhodopsin
MNTFTVTLNKHIKIRVTTRSEAIALGFIIFVWHILVLWLGL